MAQICINGPGLAD